MEARWWEGDEHGHRWTWISSTGPATVEATTLELHHDVAWKHGSSFCDQRAAGEARRGALRRADLMRAAARLDSAGVGRHLMHAVPRWRGRSPMGLDQAHGQWARRQQVDELFVRGSLERLEEEEEEEL
ncbi:hypothetical protein JDV02_002030 [Purpureocillium takamizusanense]|uniref:Uncharacterized protein n=1 Tax=Purpureocillium takamizusanense TaxID=2060973 RepID=A0A9Q8QAX3_9HYPO|nr:uncharacterized protein JDV02_002030 [Purpureocillium takamizusanense]UNI15502.1 hypothetical protein JDV02_002030 [Purpureocillium takamizusanense]